MKKYKPVWLLLGLCIFFSLIACHDEQSALQGRWEMLVEGKTIDDSYYYVIELNTSERTFEPESDLGGRKSYGVMDFSTIRHIYRYDIDSVASLGDGVYVVKSVEANMQLMGMDPVSIDTLRYDPETRSLQYNDWTFNFVPDLKPFTGEWKYSEDGIYENATLSLYKKIKAPDGYPYNGVECYGWIEYDADPGTSYRIITEVEKVHYNEAVVKCVFADYPEDGVQQKHLYYNPSNGVLECDGSYLFPVDNSQTKQSPENVEKNKSFGSTWTDILLVIWIIILLIGIYYLFKILLGYVISILICAVVGAAVGGLILWLIIGGFDLDLPRWLIITIMSVTTVPPALWGAWMAVKSTGDFVRMPFASKMINEFEKESKRKPKYVVDEYGNKKKVTSVESGILGEKYIETEDGKHYKNEWGSRDAEEQA